MRIALFAKEILEFSEEMARSRVAIASSPMPASWPVPITVQMPTCANNTVPQGFTTAATGDDTAGGIVRKKSLSPRTNAGSALLAPRTRAVAYKILWDLTRPALAPTRRLVICRKKVVTVRQHCGNSRTNATRMQGGLRKDSANRPALMPGLVIASLGTRTIAQFLRLSRKLRAGARGGRNLLLTTWSQ